MNRQQRRDIAYGRKPAPAEVVKQLRPDINGSTIIIPDMGDVMHVFQCMTPEESIPAEYFKVINCLKDLPPQGGVMNTPQDYAMLLQQWFFKGLSEFNPDLHEHVQIAPGSTFVQYVGTILRDTAPSREHKMAYLTYLLTRCCKSITWKPAIPA